MIEQISIVRELSRTEADFTFPLETVQECRSIETADTDIVGQPRAMRTLRMGLALDTTGYNIFVSGNPGSGRLEAVRRTAGEYRTDITGLRDIVYVCNFTQPDSPAVLLLPPGDGQRFVNAMDLFIETLTQHHLNTETLSRQAEGQIAHLQETFHDEQVLCHFGRLLADIARKSPQLQALPADKFAKSPIWNRYRANLLIDHAETTLRPLIIESHPTFSNLFGTIDHTGTEAHMAIHSGTLLEAAGGFIVIDAEELLAEKGLWDALKRYLDANSMTLAGFGTFKGEWKSRGIRPQMVPLPIKVILIGSEDTFDNLSEHDERFLSLFKISAQFDYSMPTTKANIARTMTEIETYAKKTGLLPLTDDAYVHLLRYSAWFAESRKELTTQFAQLDDLLVEADFWARQEGRPLIDGTMIDKANEEREYASGISENRINGEIVSGEMIIDLKGTKVGVVNGLAIMDRGSSSFGTPTVISATVAPGSEGIVNIEHEAGLSGEIHDKGLLIMEGYLRKYYAHSFPLSIYAGIAFEQSYAEVDGDSASSAELFALLSAIGELPVRQDIAVTGSVNQMGRIQPVGSINEKIEGFFKTCRLTGLTGSQGVIIPQQNIKNLILSEDVLKAIEDHSFHIHPIATINEGMRILTGRPAGIRNQKGKFPQGNFNYDIEERLRRMYQAVTAPRQ